MFKEVKLIRSFHISILFTAILIAFTGCVIPRAQFSAYQEAFANARTVSEQVLVDYEITRIEVDALDRPSNGSDADQSDSED